MTAYDADDINWVWHSALAVLQGWIPRSGLQYGADLVLYEQHPSLVHSTICVVVVPMAPPASDAEQTLILTPHGTDGALSWHDVEGINRLCVRVHLNYTCLAPLRIFCCIACFVAL